MHTYRSKIGPQLQQKLPGFHQTPHSFTPPSTFESNPGAIWRNPADPMSQFQQHTHHRLSICYSRTSLQTVAFPPPFESMPNAYFLLSEFHRSQWQLEFEKPPRLGQLLAQAPTHSPNWLFPLSRPVCLWREASQNSVPNWLSCRFASPNNRKPLLLRSSIESFRTFLSCHES